MQEVQLLAALHHERIVKYVDSYREGDELVIVLEYVQGGDLRGLMKRVIAANRVFEEKVIWSYVDQLAEGLAYMHAQRIMHRCGLSRNIGKEGI